MDGVVILAAAIRPAVKEVPDRVDAEDVGRRIRECRSEWRTGDPHAALVVEQHLQFRRVATKVSRAAASTSGGSAICFSRSRK